MPAPRPDADRPADQPADRPPDRLEEILRDHAALPGPAPDRELEALRLALLLEEELDVTLPERALDVAVLTDPGAVRALADHLRAAPGRKEP